MFNSKRLVNDNKAVQNLQEERECFVDHLGGGVGGGGMGGRVCVCVTSF